MKMLNHMSGWFYLRPAFNGNSVSDDTSLHDPNKKWREEDLCYILLLKLSFAAQSAIHKF